MHGGAKRSGGPRGNRTGNFKHGLHTRETVDTYRPDPLSQDIVTTSHPRDVTRCTTL
jgi:hypothetical protein